MVDTARQSDRRLWEDLAARAVGIPVPYRPAPGIAVYHIRVDDYVVMTAEHDLAGLLLDLVTAVMALGSPGPSPRLRSAPAARARSAARWSNGTVTVPGPLARMAGPVI